jgi:DNA-binding transcriptional ArsR family regulator
MTRARLSAADLAKVRFASTIGPLAEAWESIVILRQRRPPQHWLPWRANVQRSLPMTDQIEINTYASRSGCVLDLVAVAGPAPTAARAATAFLGASAAQIDAEVRYLVRYKDPSLTRLGLLAGDQAERRAYLRALHRYAAALLGNRWAGIESVLRADLRIRTAEAASGGLIETLARLHPAVSFDVATSTLTVSGPGSGRSPALDLGGRGLVIAPEYFTTQPRLRVPHDDEAPAVLTYPVVRHQHTTGSQPQPGLDGLAAVLGSTRAAMLATIAGGLLTQQDLADATGTTKAAISQHAAKLRAAGLITTVRRNGRSHHHLTEAGEALLRASRPGPQPRPGPPDASSPSSLF